LPAAAQSAIRTTDSKHAFPIAPDLVGRHFAAAAPNEVWVTDITYIRTREGWLYAVAESFWSTIKAELIELADFPTGAAARLAIFEYADRSPG
jgi:transposase InsO family protein